MKNEKFVNIIGWVNVSCMAIGVIYLAKFSVTESELLIFLFTTKNLISQVVIISSVVATIPILISLRDPVIGKLAAAGLYAIVAITPCSLLLLYFSGDEFWAVLSMTLIIQNFITAIVLQMIRYPEETPKKMQSDIPLDKEVE